jgi:hypothetical protein
MRPVQDHAVLLSVSITNLRCLFFLIIFSLARECVRADCPRHKIICRKPLTVETAASTAVINRATGHGQAPSMIAPFTPPMRASRACSIRPCTGRYKRSAVLIRQVLPPPQNPAIDYFLCLRTTSSPSCSQTMSSRRGFALRATT